MHNVLQVLHRAGEAINAGHNQSSPDCTKSSSTCNSVRPSRREPLAFSARTTLQPVALRAARWIVRSWSRVLPRAQPQEAILSRNGRDPEHYYSSSTGCNPYGKSKAFHAGMPQGSTQAELGPPGVVSGPAGCGGPLRIIERSVACRETRAGLGCLRLSWHGSSVHPLNGVHRATVNVESWSVSKRCRKAAKACGSGRPSAVSAASSSK